MKIRILALCAGFMLLLSALPAFAEASVDHIQVDEGRSVTVELTAEPYARIAVKVQKENDTLLGLVDEKAADENGKVVFAFLMPTTAPDGKYILSYCEEDNAAQDCPFDFADTTSIVAFLHTASSAQEIAEFLKPEAGNRYKAEIMGLNMELYDTLDAQEQLHMLEQYLTLRNGASQEEILDAFSKAMGIQISDKDKALALAMYNPEFEGTRFNDIADDAQKQWIAETLSVSEKSAEGFERAYTQAQAIYKLVNAKSVQVAGIIEEYGDILGITSSSKYMQYSNLSSDNKGKVHDKLVDGLDNARTVQAVCSVFENAVADVMSPSQGSSSGGNRGSSSGSGGGRPVTVGSITSSGQSEPVKDNPPFNDLTGYDWAEEAISGLVSYNVIAGYGDGSFRPAQAVTREEFVKMAVCAAGILQEGAECDFTDVDGSQWYYRYIASGVENGIIIGIGDNQFGIGETITRQDMAVIVCRLVEKQGINLAQKRSYANYDDESSIADYAKESIRKLYSAGFINGVSETSFMPLENATRAQAAKLLYDVFYNGEEMS